jgi:hypothetical protein
MSTSSQITSSTPLTDEGLDIELKSSLRKGLNLKTFVLTPEMSTFLGVFYPTGYIVVMFPNVHQAEQAAHELVMGGYDGQAIMLLPPETILREIAPSDPEDSDIDLPYARSC